VWGEAVDLRYDYAHLGTDGAAVAAQIGIDHPKMEGREAVVVLGQGALTGEDGAAVLGHVQKFCADTGAKLLILHVAAGRVGAMDVGAVNDDGMAAAQGADVIYNLGADEIEIADGAFFVYQGSHGDRGAHRADVILPGAAYTEEQGLFVNTEGRPQLAMRASFPPGDARENWAILRALSAEVGETLPFDTLGALRGLMVKGAPHLAMIDEVAENEGAALDEGKLGSGDFASPIGDHYLTNPITRASSLMAELSANAKARAEAPMAAE